MPKENDREIDDFLKQFEKDVGRLEGVSHLMNVDSVRENVSVFYNAYRSYELTRSIRHLAYATIVLGLATVVQTINVTYGLYATQNILIEVLKIILILIIVAIVLGVLFDLSHKRTI